MEKRQKEKKLRRDLKKARQERPCVACFHLCEMTGRLLVARDQGQGKGVTANKYGVLYGGR